MVKRSFTKARNASLERERGTGVRSRGRIDTLRQKCVGEEQEDQGSHQNRAIHGSMHAKNTRLFLERAGSSLAKDVETHFPAKDVETHFPHVPTRTTAAPAGLRTLMRSAAGVRPSEVRFGALCWRIRQVLTGTGELPHGLQHSNALLAARPIFATVPGWNRRAGKSWRARSLARATWAANTCVARKLSVQQTSLSRVACK